ncbi:MAG: DUF2891 domain-containing protein [Gemmatimonadaceae bacterium]
MTDTEQLLRMTPEYASRFARLALSHVSREYPNKLDHVMSSVADAKGPRELHPIFYGSFDWHSCVHGYWLLANVLRRFPQSAELPAIRELFDERLTAANVMVERDYAAHATHAGFERPYGWAWLLMLSAELSRNHSDEGKRWFSTLQPLADVFVGRFLNFLPRATYPIRTGAHSNTAFALALASEYCAAVSDDELKRLLTSAARRWYSNDVDAPAWEPSGDDFLSPTLIEAECMRRLLTNSEFVSWFEKFLPRISERLPATLFEPATVSDRTDGKIAHLDGLNLSRAWCWRSLGAAFSIGTTPGSTSQNYIRTIAHVAATVHWNASIPHVSGDYMGEHWLATYATLALDAGESHQ